MAKQAPTVSPSILIFSALVLCGSALVGIYELHLRAQVFIKGEHVLGLATSSNRSVKDDDDKLYSVELKGSRRRNHPDYVRQLNALAFGNDDKPQKDASPAPPDTGKTSHPVPSGVSHIAPPPTPNYLALLTQNLKVNALMANGAVVNGHFVGVGQSLWFVRLPTTDNRPAHPVLKYVTPNALVLTDGHHEVRLKASRD